MKIIHIKITLKIYMKAFSPEAHLALWQDWTDILV